MFAQIPAFFDDVFSKYQCRFRKGYQHCHLKILEKWKTCVGKEQVFGGLSTDLSKEFDYLDHKLLTVKLNACSFNLSALRLVYDYLSNRNLKLCYHTATV